ncbi:MAG: hypothetical protein A2V99_00280 [Spirochaetes bacterium RBG_16_67_19]|nr:MAG: hypothetical protein A2V99_00280 [Spirochaetes bacterium RBG_16_67_19]
MRTATLRVEALIDAEDTADFLVNRLRLTRGQTALERAPAVRVVTGGAGTIRMEGFSRALSRGDYFFLPAAARGALLATEGKLEVVECGKKHLNGRISSDIMDKLEEKDKKWLKKTNLLPSLIPGSRTPVGSTIICSAETITSKWIDRPLNKSSRSCRSSPSSSS